MKLTVGFESFEQWAKRTRARTKKLSRGEKIQPSRRINFELPLPPEPELLKSLEERLLQKSPKNFSSRDIDLIIKLSRAQRKIDAAAKAERVSKGKER